MATMRRLSCCLLLATSSLATGLSSSGTLPRHSVLTRITNHPLSSWKTCEEGRRSRHHHHHRRPRTSPRSRISPAFLSSRSDEDDRGDNECGGGPILVPSYDDPKRFDAACVANPVVLPPPPGTDERWKMYYYGHAGSWNRRLPALLPTGWCGLAESEDGVRWTKVDGREENGAILGPSDDPDEWDSVQIGVGDVVRVPSENGGEELHMYYFGGSSEPVGLGSMGGGVELAGFRMRIGRARSADGGRTWEKMGVCLDCDESEGVFASWPRIILPSKEGESYRMIYHAFNGKTWRVFGAESFDHGSSWNRTGLVLEGGDDEEDFDFKGIGTRAIVPWRDGLLMIYEGVCKNGKHRLGAAYSSNSNEDPQWEKISNIEGRSRPGGPILEPGIGAMGPWTSTVVGTPYLLPMQDGTLRLYFVGKAGDDGHSIGCIRSEFGDISPGSWRSC